MHLDDPPNGRIGCGAAVMADADCELGTGNPLFKSGSPWWRTMLDHPRRLD